MLKENEYIFNISGKRELIYENNIDFIINKAIKDIGGEKNISKVTKIILSSKSIMPNAAKKLCNIINLMDSLTYVDCSDIMSCIEMSLAFETLAILSETLFNKKIKYLNLDDNALGTRGIYILQSLFQNNTITDISLCNVGISTESIDLLTKNLIPINIKSLKFFKNMIGDIGSSYMANLLLQCPLLENLKWASVRASGNGAVELANSLSSLNNLKSLDLSDNTFGNEGGFALAKSLKNKFSLESINLSDISANSSLNEILYSLSKLYNLKKLKLNENEIDDDSELINCLQNHVDSLTELHLDGNYIGDKGCLKISKLFSNCKTLKVLNLINNDITDKGANSLIENLCNKDITLLLNKNFLSKKIIKELEVFNIDVIEEEYIVDQK